MNHKPDTAVKPQSGDTKSEITYPIQRGPWTALRSQIKYSNPWISVREDQVICPDGSEGIYGVVEPRIAVGVLAMTENNELYLVGQYRYPTERYSWEIVEGGVEEEDPLDAIKRELAEEAGLAAKNWQLLAQNIQLSNCYTSEMAHLYLATDLSPAFGVPDSTELLEVKSVKFSQALEMVLNGEITDSLSMLGILLVANKFKSE